MDAPYALTTDHFCDAEGRASLDIYHTHEHFLWA